MKQRSHELLIQSGGQGLVELTADVLAWVQSTEIREGLLTLHVMHTSASLLLQENADPDVRTDLEGFLRNLVPEGNPSYLHSAEGPDDMPSHIRTALTPTSLSIPVAGGRPALGTWQGIYLYEHRRRPHRRRVAMHLMGE